MDPERAPAKRVGISLREDSVVCETGGGFTKTEWQVSVNDGWMKLSQLLKRGTVDTISTELEDEDDPHGAAGSHWLDRPPQVYYRRSTRVVAPIGTRFRKLVSTPVRTPDGIRFSRTESEVELYGEERYASPGFLAERADHKARQAAQARERMPKSDTLHHLRALVSQLGEALPAASIPVVEAPSTVQASSRRKPPVRHEQPRIESTPQGKKGSNSA